MELFKSTEWSLDTTDEYKSSPLDSPGNIEYALSLNRIYIYGKFIGEEAHECHRTLLDRINYHYKQANKLALYFTYETFDCSTLSYIFKIFKAMNKAHNNDKEARIIWEYSANEEMLDVGMDLVPFTDFQVTITYSSC